jgi:prepilin-type N-terminal cleavage/methylation domain-containing protein
MRYVVKHRLPRRRPGFTLVEIMAVLAIIVILVGLSAAGLFYFIGSQKSRNTQGTIRAVNKIFQEQWSYVIEQAKKESPSAAVVVAAGSDPTGERARVLWIKMRLIEAFPISYAEINNNATNNDPIFLLLQAAIPANQRKGTDTYQRITNGAKAANNSATESIACLLMALSISRGGSVLSPDQLGSFVADTDGDGINEIVDGWGSPLMFYRFAWGTSPPAAMVIPGSPGAPGGIQGLNPAPAGSKTAKLADPLDPGGLLLTWQGAGRTAFELNVHRIAGPATGAPTGTTTPPTYYVIPVIMSLGPDQDKAAGVLTPSLYPPTQCPGMGLQVQNAATAADNIYSFNLTGN